MAAPLHIQASAVNTSTSSTLTITLTGVTAGSTLALLLGCNSAATRTYTVSDDRNGSWLQAVYTNPARGAGIWYKTGSASGTVVITITQNSTHNVYTVVAVEIGPSSFDVASSFDDSTNQTTHNCSASTALDTAANVYILSGGVLNASGTTLTKNASATLLDATSGTVLRQYRRSDTALTDERSAWTSSTSRTGLSVSASFVATSSGQTINLGLASEVNDALALTITNPRTYALGVSSELDEAFTLNITNPRTYALGTATETDSVPNLSVVNARTYVLGTAIELDEALGLTINGSGQMIAVGTAIESETALPLIVVNPRSYALGLAIETDESLALTVINPRTHSIGVASETDISLGLTIINPRTYPLGTASETDVALGITILTGSAITATIEYYLRFHRIT